ncbi:MAG: nucleotide sugar dehydrogenase [Candidatus Hydrothermarchaeaceae archaeon]
MRLFEELKDKIVNRRCNIGVLGLGYVGLPMAALFADKGFRVLGGDISESVVEKVNAGVSPVKESGMDELMGRAVGKGLLSTTTDVKEVVRVSDVLLVVVQTPIGDDKKPDLAALRNACSTVASDPSGKLVIVESTLPPGTTHETIIPILESSDNKAGEDFYLVYSPERAMPTRLLEEIQSNPRIIGGLTEESSELASLLYGNITTGQLVTTEIEIAEVVKVLENTYRDVNIALANEIAMLCEKLGVDAVKAIEIANKHPRVHLLSPGPGVGGHCIPKDPYFALDSARKHGLELRIISSARKVNEAMPGHVLGLIEKALGSAGKKLEDSKIAILGVTYKGDTNDTRGSPSRDIVQSLLPLSEVFSHDPLANQDFGGNFSKDMDEAVKDADCVVVVADHMEYANLDLDRLSRLVKKPGVIVDGRRILDPEDAREKGFSYFGIGY